MKTRQELNRAIGRLRKLNRAAVAKQAQTYAESLLPDAARHRSVTDLTALMILSITLYTAAIKCVVQDHGFHTVQHILERRYALLVDGNSVERVLAQDATCVEGFETNRRALMRLPMPFLAAGVKMACEAIRMLQ